MLKRLLPYLLLSVMVLSAYGIVSYQLNQNSVEQTEAAFNEQQALQVALSARSIEDHFNSRLSIVLLAAYQPTISVGLMQLPEWTESGPEGFLADYLDEFRGVGLFLGDAAPVYLSLSDDRYAQMLLESWVADHGEAVLTTNQPFVPPIVATPDHQFYGVLVPVGNDEAQGIIGAVLDFGPILESYVAPVRSGQYGAAWVQDHNGTVIYDHETFIIGENVADLHAGYTQVEALDQRYLIQDSGISEYSFTVERGGDIQRKLVAWDTAIVGNQRLTIALSAPDSEISTLMASTHTNILGLGILMVGVLVIGSIIGVHLQTRQLAGQVEERTRALEAEHAALLESEERLNLALAGGNLAMWDWNLKTDEVIYSKQWSDLLGYDLAELEPHISTSERLAHPDDWPLVLADIQAHLDGKTPIFENEHRMKAKSGEWRWIQARGKCAEYAEDGTPLRLVGTHHDITQRRGFEAALQQERNLFMSGPVVAMKWSTQVNQPLEYVSPNIKMFGYEADDLTSGKVLYRDFVHPDDLQRMRDEIRQYTEAGLLFFERDYRIVQRDGQVRHVHDFTMVIRDEQGNATKYHGYILDVTERRRAARATLELAMERERISILGQFIQDASHEFRTPLSIIKTNTYMLGMQADDKEKRLLQTIERQANSIHELIEELVAMARLDSGVDFKRESLHINQPTRTLAETVTHQAEAQGKQFQTILGDNLPLVMGDLKWLYEALHHLIDNAIRFTPEGGTITLRTLTEDDRVIVEVSDTGMGINADDHEKIFKRFFRADEAHTTRGFGLGLPIVKAIVEAHQGQITFDSTPGVGSTFRISLPTSISDKDSD